MHRNMRVSWRAAAWLAVWCSLSCGAEPPDAARSKREIGVTSAALSCGSDFECLGTNTPRCDSGECVQCVNNLDCVWFGTGCRNNRCDGCLSDADCSGGRCLDASCVECASDADCASDAACSSGRCTRRAGEPLYARCEPGAREPQSKCQDGLECVQLLPDVPPNCMHAPPCSSPDFEFLGVCLPACSSDSECPSGWHCRPGIPVRSCVPA
jgi:hypothetical protein